MSDSRMYTVSYQFATYSGQRTVWADDADHALAKVRGLIRKESSLPMAYERYEIVSCA